MALPTAEIRVRSHRELNATRVVIGSDKHAVLVCDDFFEDPDAVRRMGIMADYAPAECEYPGSKAPVVIDPKQVTECLNPFFETPIQLKAYYSNFSLLLRPSQFHPGQRIPHRDNWDLAGVVYLNPPAQCRGGIGFYRHRKSGLERLDDEQGWPAAATEGIDLRELGDIVRFYGVPAFGTNEWVKDTGDTWELVHFVEMKYNRMVFYEGHLFHGALLPHEESFGDTPDTRRLTANFYCGVEAPTRLAFRRNA
jgi:hypothetical protein